MKQVSFVWGVGGILALLGFAVVRLGAVALETREFELLTMHWLLLVVWVPYMLWAEGYKGFFLGFAPRVVARASYLANNPRPLHVLAAPLFCMGYIHATPRRRLLSFGLTGMIICFVLVVRLLPQPWRGIIDFGVVAGLVLGMVSITWFLLQLHLHPGRLLAETDVPSRL